MKRLLLLTCWTAVLGIAAFLRLHALDERPMHADEATGARITSLRLEDGSYAFDPLHYHGPTLSRFAMTSARAAGQTRWSELEKTPLRVVPALAGILLAIAPALGRRRFGDGPMLLAALALATSPLLVYYSRMFIHEMLLALFGILALAAFCSRRHAWLAGLWIGLMFATKETFAISVIAWGAALAVLWLASLRTPGRPRLAALAREHWRPAALGLALALLASLFFYTNGFTRWQGAVDAVRTFFVYELVEGHDKGAGYYFELLLRPRRIEGLMWTEVLLPVLALVAVVASFAARGMPATTRFTIRFLALAAGFHVAAYLCFAYKTPWLMVVPWAHVALLAGFAACALPPCRKGVAIAVAALVAAGIGWQWTQARNATSTFASDDRNPYAYVPTAGDIETLGPWLRALDASQPGLPLEPLAMVGDEYWPLPWYLRHYGKVGYWAEPPANLGRLPVVFATSDLSAELAATHVPVPRGLRTDTPMMVWVRQDFWDASTDADSP